MAHFNTNNPDQLIYENSILTIEVLGGVRLEGLDRMRVTLKVSLNESEIPPLRHNLDLYNDTQLEKFIRKIAERLEVGTSVTAGTLAELTQALENYRLEKIKEQNHENAQPVKPLTEKEKAEAIKNLSAPELLGQTIQDLAASGIQGEAENLATARVFSRGKLTSMDMFKSFKTRLYEGLVRANAGCFSSVVLVLALVLL